MASRLDKLFDLLESNNTSIRSTAAIQIGKLATNNQVQISSLLAKLLPFVKHKSWSVRIAASDAVKHIGLNCKPWLPNRYISDGKTENVTESITLEKLNLLEILKIGTRLYSTDMREIDEVTGDTNGGCHDEIGRHLGFLIPEECEIGRLVDSDDLRPHKSAEDDRTKLSVATAVSTSLSRRRRLSNDERGAKRAHSVSSDIDVGEPNMKVQRVNSDGSDSDRWPWSEFCDALLADLWHAKWETRHGAATALRELVRSQGAVMVGRNGRDFATRHGRYQEEVVGRLLCTLALDQLSDFVSDEMVAPVRESCAQVLGIMSIHLPQCLVTALASNFLSLLEYKEWTVNHGALLGLKYLIAARLDMADTLLPLLYGPISSHLKESCDDDVRCAAAAALMPIFARPGCVSLEPIDNLESLKIDLWHLLALRPDYTSPGATIAVLQLLEKLYEQQQGKNLEEVTMVAGGLEHVSSALNRLHWCYYSYSDAVRLAAMRCCDALLRAIESQLAQLPPVTISQVLCQLFQRVLLDDSDAVTAHAELLWHRLVGALSSDVLAQACLDRLDVWMCCAMQPARLSYAPGALLLPDFAVATVATEGGGGPNAAADECKLQLPNEFFIGGRDSYLTEGDSAAREDAVLRARTAACRLLAEVCRAVCEISPIAEHILVSILARVHLKERLAVQRFVAASILANWRTSPAWVEQSATMLAPLRAQLLAALEEPLYYQELLPAFRQMAKASRDLLACYGSRGIDTGMTTTTQTGTLLNLVQCQSLVTPDLCTQLSIPSDLCVASAARTAVDICAQQHASLSRLVDTALARALLQWGWLPQRMTPLIRPLTDALRCDARAPLQSEAATALAQLVIDYGRQCRERLAAPAGKLVRNIVQYHSDAIDSIAMATMAPVTDDGSGCDIVALGRIAQFGRDAFPCQEEVGTAAAVSICDNGAVVKLRGARMALQRMCARIVADGDVEGSLLWHILCGGAMQLLTADGGVNRGAILAALRSMAACIPHLWNCDDVPAIPGVMDYARCVFHHGLCHQDALVRHWSARVLAVLIMPASSSSNNNDNNDTNNNCCIDLVDVLLLGEALTALQSLTSTTACLGSMELIYMVLHSGHLPYRLALVAPLLPAVLRCLSAPIDAVRRMATHTFSLLLSLLPLEPAGADLWILSQERRRDRVDSGQFIAGLLHPDALRPYEDHAPVVTASLRHYQQQGLNWLAFLNRYGLHGVLADDMGLGKTLQAICVIVGEHRRGGSVCQPSLVVCPPTLTRHWQQEISRHVAMPDFSSVVYTGSVEARLALYPSLHGHQVVITSYDILRNDIDRLSRPPGNSNDGVSSSSSESWHYLVLDEGHLIRNHKSKVAIAAKAVCARHRLVLTGTPIQNRVGELWSLFDFLMPGLLGTHADFQRRYGRSLDQAASVTRKTDLSGDSGGLGTGTLALEQLHKQVLPFMLRRVKEDVLHELPPKIIQDYSCAMTALQQRLYHHCLAIASASANDGDGDASIDDLLQQSSSSSSSSTSSPQPPAPMAQHRRQHVFQTLHHLRQVCNHPKLVLTDAHPLYASVKRELAAANGGGGTQSLDDVALSGKLVALKQLILDCGVGTDDSTASSIGGTAAVSAASDSHCDVVSSHRLLVFCQSRAMVTLVESMFRSDIPKASYLRLDGSISIKERQNIVDKFNQDASIDMLLLTTAIGGLGLNLTSADVVIFVEHDWNPMRDMQAMDRAHRIGQRHTVNVYRLITADSVEERIMNLQRFKLHVAAHVVGGDNKQMDSMHTDDLLDLMDTEARQRVAGTTTTKAGTTATTRSRLDGAYDSLDEYGEEYSLDSFVNKL